jgi:acetolactate synthase-1/3 small subunit
MKKSHTLSILVRNQPGVLAKIAGTFFRRDYNIETMTVCKTHVRDLTKILISGQADDRDAEHLRRQIENMVDVREARLLDRSQSLTLEMCLVQIGCKSPKERAEIMTAADPYRPNLRALNGRSIVLEAVGNPGTVDDFIQAMGQFTILDVSRTGTTVLGPSLPTMHDEAAADHGCGLREPNNGHAGQ